MPRYTVSSNELTHLNGEPVQIGDVVEMPAGAARRFVASSQLTPVEPSETDGESIAVEAAKPAKSTAKQRARSRKRTG